MEEDPAFYKKFSEMLKETIEAHEYGRITDAQKLKKVTEIMNAVLSHIDADIPESLSGHEVAKAFFVIAKEGIKNISYYRLKAIVGYAGHQSKP
jgi:type I restriction enzyme R subunit